MPGLHSSKAPQPARWKRISAFATVRQDGWPLTRGIRITPEEEEEYFVLLPQKLSAQRLAEIGIEMYDEFASRTKRLRVAEF